jgi:hypothetical protein
MVGALASLCEEDYMDDKTYQRFMAKVSVSEHGCWLWLGGKDGDGYGLLEVYGKGFRAHRLAYEHWHGPIGEGLYVLHRCDDPSCVNPDHLWMGTQAENIADMYAKGRQANRRGEYHGRAKLTADMVCEIRLLQSDFTLVELARRFMVSPRLISKILKGELWQHVL